MVDRTTVIFLVVFVLVERKVHHPVIDLSVFKRFTFSASALVSLLVGAALIIAMADIPLFVDTVLSKQIPSDQVALFSGLALLRMTAMIPIGAFLGGWLSGRVTSRVTGVIGLLFTAVGFYLMSRWSMNGIRPRAARSPRIECRTCPQRARSISARR